MFKILSINSKERSSIAVFLKNNGGFYKIRNKYVANDLEITFLNETNITEECINDFDLICGKCSKRNTPDFIRNSEKYSNKILLHEVKKQVLGEETLYLVVSQFNSGIVKILPKTVFSGDLSHHKACFKTEKEAIEYAYEEIKKQKIYLEAQLEKLKELEKEYNRSLNSF